ncbi:hypothetical protein [Janthinobacterium sp.]|uniref:hypothetical protein n=1 Tax=Janthinobacterium sp. TaxID=1871054 RepID=UPI00293D64C7|nr:hypothetical protein [Janthinobacterium sp.]
MATAAKFNGDLKDMWLGDYGASLHACNDAKYMSKVRPSTDQVTISDSSTVTAKARGKAHLQTEYGQIIDLDEVLFIPGFDRNIISVERFAQKGHHVEMCGKVIKVCDSVWSLDKKTHLKFERNDIYII